MKMIRLLQVALGLVASLALAAPTDPKEPTNLEQYMLEVINRARANPDAEAARHGLALNEGPPTYGADRGMVPISSAPKQPLALDVRLVERARADARWQVDHPTSVPADSPVPSIVSSGIVADIVPKIRVAGTIIGGFKSALEPTAAEVDSAQKGLFIDQNARNGKGESVNDRHHRVIMLWDGFSVVGIGAARAKVAENGTFKGKLECNLIATDVHFLTGVAYRDADRNRFYTPGEGLGGVQVRAVRRSDKAAFTTATWGSGGYTLQLVAGTYDVRFSGSSGQKTVSGVEIEDRNLKVDFVAPTN